jgi:DNA invertase Pin-like site-specific DNA recombinase
MRRARRTYDATTELLAAVAAWIATQESVRGSERIRADLARRRVQGKPMGGAASKRGKDKRPRRTEGYKQAWALRKAGQEPTQPSREARTRRRGHLHV